MDSLIAAAARALASGDALAALNYVALRDDPPALVDALDSVLSNLGSYDRDAIAADARARYSLEAVGAQLQGIYDSLRSASAADAAAAAAKAAES